jgi:truncated hemoglobin YjbI
MIANLHSDLATPSQRHRFVELFAARIAEDELLGPVFGHTGHVSRGEYVWWEQALTGMRYYGRLLANTAAQLPCNTYFERWCAVLESTFRQYFHGPGAAEAQGYVLNLATMLEHWRLAQQRHKALAHPSHTGSKSQLAA